MVKIHRNAACLCGSGKKYKLCCLPADSGVSTQEGSHEPIPRVDELDELEGLSNGILDLIDAGRLEDAERACSELEHRFPDQIDWLDRTGSLHEARGDPGSAIGYYQRCLDFIGRNPKGFEDSSKQLYRSFIERLESIR
jgi:tetratricopeptide (TPR) repeat protein